MANVYDYLRLGALVIGFVAAACRDRKTWMLADAILSSSGLISAIVAPTTLFYICRVTSVKYDESQAYVMHNILIVTLAPAIMWLLSGRTRDDNVVGSLLWGRLVSLMFVTMAMVHAQITSPGKFNNRHLWCILPMNVMWLLATGYQLYRHKTPVGRREQPGGVSWVFRIGLVLFFFTSLTHMAYPRYVLSLVVDVDRLKPDFMMLYAIRAAGAMFMSVAFLCWYAPSFRYDYDKRSVFHTLMVVHILLMISTTNYYFFGKAIMQREYWMLAGLAAPVLPLVGMYLMREDVSTIYGTGYNTRSKQL